MSETDHALWPASAGARSRPSSTCRTRRREHPRAGSRESNRGGPPLERAVPAPHLHDDSEAMRPARRRKEMRARRLTLTGGLLLLAICAAPLIRPIVARGASCITTVAGDVC